MNNLKYSKQNDINLECKNDYNNSLNKDIDKEKNNLKLFDDNSESYSEPYFHDRKENDKLKVIQDIKTLKKKKKNHDQINKIIDIENSNEKKFLGKKRNNQKNSKNKNDIYNNFNKEKNKSQENIKKLNYELIPSDKLDDINFLKANYPKLFLQGTKVKFKIQELLKTGIGVGDYHFGIIDNFNPENNSFLIKNCTSLNEKTLLFMYQCDEEDLMSIELKNFVEIWIESEKEGKNYLGKDPELIKHFIRRQVEFYFCDKNYEKDSFLKKNEDDNGYIPINVIMNFNKIKMITKNENEFIEALKEEGNKNLGENNNKSYEFNEDFSKIRKIKLFNEN